MPMDPMAMSRAFELKMLKFRPYGSHDMSGVVTIDFIVQSLCATMFENIHYKSMVGLLDFPSVALVGQCIPLHAISYAYGSHGDA